MKISAVLAGGLGDYILSTRFLKCVRDEMPDCHVKVFSNNDGLTTHDEFFRKHWPDLFDEFVRVERGSKNFKIKSQYGEELYNDAFNNILEEHRAEILKSDIVYKFYPDYLDFLKYRDIPWTKYTRFIPTPSNIQAYDMNLPEDFVVVNLYAREGHFSALAKEYSDDLITKLKSENNIVILAPSEEVRDTFYSKFKTDVVVADLELCLWIISKSRIGVSIDTGLRCLFYAFGKSCFTLCRMVHKYFSPPPSHQLRWYQWPENMLPINANPDDVVSLIRNSRLSIGCELFPYFSPDVINAALINRIYD